jgi:hypothetical protein
MAPPDTISSDAGASTLRGSTRLVLHLGVAVLPYRSKGKKAGALTTGDVAGFLEAKYGLMAAFYRVHQSDVAKAIENSLGGALESLLMGQTIDPWGRAMQAIQQEFKDFISSKEAERVGIPGTPTKAALAGVNPRLKHPYARGNARRPSFRASGMYMNSFRAWMD